MNMEKNSAVLLSIKPNWCELIVDGKKTVEVRKNKPDLKPPFKCYIYCTLGKSKKFTRLAEAMFFGDGKQPSNGKVIGEFICDEIVPIKVFEDGAIQNWNFYGLENACIPYEDMATYIKAGKRGYGWHISSLTIYDQPKPLSEFARRAPWSWCYVARKD